MCYRTRLFALLFLIGICCILSDGVPNADDAVKKPGVASLDKAAADSAKEASAPTHKVEKGPFKIEVSVKGVIETEDMTEVALTLQAGGIPLSVRKAVEHGATVKKGDTLIALDLEKIDQAIRDAEAERDLADLAIRLAEEELPVLEKSTPLDVAIADRTKKTADEDLKKWQEVDRPFTEKRVLFSVKQAQNQLDYQKEELRQLEKMYKANDLTEETEEIILKRQRNAVESADFFLKSAELERDRQLKVELPRRDQDLRDSAIKQALALDRARATLPLALNQKKLSLDKTKYERAKSNERLVKLKRDREAMTITSPADGIVYYGKCTRGQWSGTASMASKLQRAGTIAADEVLMTIVKPQNLFVRAVVEEADVHHFRPGLEGKLQAPARPDVKLGVKVANVSPIPITSGNFEARISIDPRKDNDGLMPGMACTVKFVSYRKEQAIKAPTAAVFSDDLNEDVHFVYLVKEDGKPDRVAVTIGKKTDKEVEILSGLEDGCSILLNKPTSSSQESKPSSQTLPSLNGKAARKK